MAIAIEGEAIPSASPIFFARAVADARSVALDAALGDVRGNPVVVSAQLRRRLDVVAHVVFELLEDEERGLARRQAEALADLANADLVRACLAFERGKRQACPL